MVIIFRDKQKRLYDDMSLCNDLYEPKKFHLISTIQTLILLYIANVFRVWVS